MRRCEACQGMGDVLRVGGFQRCEACGGEGHIVPVYADTDRDRLIVKAASFVPPHSFINNNTWDDATEVQCSRRCDLAEAVLVGIGLIQPRRKGPHA